MLIRLVLKDKPNLCCIMNSTWFKRFVIISWIPEVDDNTTVKPCTEKEAMFGVIETLAAVGSKYSVISYINL